MKETTYKATFSTKLRYFTFLLVCSVLLFFQLYFLRNIVISYLRALIYYNETIDDKFFLALLATAILYILYRVVYDTIPEVEEAYRKFKFVFRGEKKVEINE